jgi:formylglycine-generating enzyme required for sulfatase activity
MTNDMQQTQGVLYDLPAPSRAPLSGSLVLLLALVGSPLVAQEAAGDADAAKVQRWAILIGINDYANAQDLEYSVADQRALGEQLVAAGFSNKQIFVLSDQAKESKYLPFKSNIVKQLELVLGLAEINDLVVVAFSGHGVQFDNTAYLCPTDAHLDDPSSLVSLDWVYEQLQRCPAALKVLMVDACRNDPRIGGQRNFSPTEGTRQFAQSLEKPLPEGIVLLTSCSAGEISMEEREFGHGVFMHYVVEGLRGKADADGDGKITLNEVSRYAGQETKVYVARKFSESQRPKLKGDLTIEALDFPIASLARSTAFPPIPPASGPLAKTVTNAAGMKLVLIPAGEFVMGSPASEERRTDDETQHRVRLTRPFYLGAYEVTQGEFQQVMGRNPSHFSATGLGKDNAAWSKANTSRLPVEQVSWYDAAEFCNRLSEADNLPPYYSLQDITRNDGAITKATVQIVGGAGYRLPTEAEWEYACRAGTTTPFHFGAQLNGREANTNGNYPYGTTAKGPFLQRTTTIGSYASNAFGLYDMHGNVWEWCQDWYDADYYTGSPTDDPRGPESGAARVLRGGSWVSDPRFCRSAYRGWFEPALRDSDTGFRVARTP